MDKMEKKKTNASDEASKINEDELEQVAGGIGATWDCWFKGKDDSNLTVYPADTQFIEMECVATCFDGLTQCACHGTDRCVGKKHKMEKAIFEGHTDTLKGIKTMTAFPHPTNQYNHVTRAARYFVPL